MKKTEFGITRDAQVVDRYRMTNSGGAYIDVITYGACITSWVSNDVRGQASDIVLGYDHLRQYEDCGICMGGIPGRYANRIANGRFSIDEKTWQLERNNNGHHLHGGSRGFHKQVWQAHIESGGSDHGDAPGVVLTLESPDGDSGYPGHLSVRVRYSLSEDNALTIDYSAQADKPTVINLTNHSYFNLQGHHHAIENSIAGHALQLMAKEVLEVDDSAIPTGRLLPVHGTAFDFTRSKPLAETAGVKAGQGNYYDHCYVLDDQPVVARLYEPLSGRCLETATTFPGMQLYTAIYMDNCAGKAGQVYGRRGAVCLEAQCYPDSPNQPGFPSTLLRPGVDWQHKTTYRLTLATDTVAASD